MEVTSQADLTLEVLCLSHTQVLQWQEYHQTSKLDMSLMCCHREDHCTPGLFALPSDLQGPETYYRYDWNQSTSALDWTRQCNESGIYALIIGTCSSNSSLDISGTVEIRNPFGYMSGEDYPLLLFYEGLSEVYIVLTLLWVLLLFWHRSSAVAIQKWVISSVLLSCALESLACALEWRHYNEVGLHSPVLVAGVSLLNSWRGSFSRMLMLAMSQGLGVIRSSLGSSLTHIMFLGGGYFVSNLFYDLALFYTQHSQLPTFILLIATLPVTCLNAVCYYWVFTSLVDAKQLLASQKQAFKLAIYERLITVLVAAGGASILCVCVEM